MSGSCENRVGFETRLSRRGGRRLVLLIALGAAAAPYTFAGLSSCGTSSPGAGCQGTDITFQNFSVIENFTFNANTQVSSPVQIAGPVNVPPVDFVPPNAVSVESSTANGSVDFVPPNAVGYESSTADGPADFVPPNAVGYQSSTANGNGGLSYPISTGGGYLYTPPNAVSGGYTTEGVSPNAVPGGSSLFYSLGGQDIQIGTIDVYSLGGGYVNGLDSLLAPPTPEPATFGLLGSALGAIALLKLRSRRKRS